MKINPKLKDDLKSFLLEKIQEEGSRVAVYSADILNVEDKKVLEKKFSNLNWKKAVYKVDKLIIAGIIIRVGSRTVDLSLSGSLSKLSNTLYEID